MGFFSRKKQEIGDGVGPVYHRAYEVVLPVSWNAAKSAMEKLKHDINAFSPQWIARFEKVIGEDGPLKLDHGFQIHLPGPWDGPVKVSAEHENGFTLATLDGHLEAGEIAFEIKPELGRVKFTIESVARSKDALVDIFYDKIPVVRLAQTKMWESFCQSFAKEALGTEEEEHLPEVKVSTARLNKEGQWERT